MSKLKAGVYQHFKGNFYLVLGTALHSETELEMVVYVSLYENKKSAMWVRPLKMFLEKVEKDSKKVPRFKFVDKKST